MNTNGHKFKGLKARKMLIHGVTRRLALPSAIHLSGLQPCLTANGRKWARMAASGGLRF